MKKTICRYGRRVLTAALALLMLAGICMPSSARAAERGPQDYVFTDYVDGYHLTSFLNGYNVLAFDSVYLGLHCVGALLIQGTYEGGSGNSGFADGENMPPSYIKGYLAAPNSVYNSRNHQVDPLYVGSVNNVSTWQDWYTTYYSVNGLNTGNNSTTPVYVSDNFFNFAQAYAVVKHNQEQMKEESTLVTPDADGVITISVGQNVRIDTLDGVKSIHIVGDMEQVVNTTINILEGGDLTVPSVYVNGKHPAVVEQAEDGTSLVWNFGDAASVQLPTQNWLGHVIAPDAAVSQMSGNYNGCIICHSLYSSAEGHLYNYASDDTSWETVFSVQKVWNDGNDADGKRPDHINVQLLANGRPHGRPVRLEARKGWYYVWTDLPETDKAGNRITYTVQEARVPGYTSSYDAQTQTLINTHEYETVDISGTKTWLNEWGWSRPWSITVRLYADGHEVASQVVNTSYWGGSNRYSFTNLPKYKDGREIVYTVHEDPVPGYMGTADGYNLINTFGVEPIVISGKKLWDDNNDADGLRPEEVVIQLLANGTVIEEHHAAANTKWEFTFGNLPEYDEQGARITYTVREKTTPRGYTATVDGYDIINRHEPETTSVSGRKTWNDDNNNDGKRPSSITVILLANLAEVDRKTVTEADGWAWNFTDLPKNHAGTPIRYTVKEEPVADYISHTYGMNLTNSHENETVDISGRKTWEDKDNADGKRPSSITINLLADGIEIAEKTVTAADNWAWSFTGLPKYADGAEIVYTITEDAVADYTTVVSGYNVTNTYEPETTSVSGSKTWNDANNQDGKRPGSITINLLADGIEVAEKTVTAADNWAWSFTGLPKYADGAEIVYTITEDAVADYTTVVSGYNVTNTYEPETTSVSGSKTWNDASNQDGKRPGSITINLLADGIEVAEKAVTAADNWAWSFTDLPKYADGAEIVYTITEDAVADYTTVVSGYNVANTYEPETTSVSGSKTWNDASNQDGKRPGSITINLLADGIEVAEKTVTAADNWAWSFTDLPKYADGAEIVYTITEDAVADYTTVVSGYNVTNTYEPETTSVSGSKTWNDASNQDGKRPSSITINLLADGIEIAEKTVTAADSWAWSFTDLPKYADGAEIVYTITEDTVADYTTVVSGYNVANTYEPETTSVSGSKTWNDASNQDGKRPGSITINLLADGIEVAEKTVTAADNWAWSFTDLPKYADGAEIVYTITEDAVADYTTVVSGYNVTNTYEPETTSVSGSKTWRDDGDRDGLRPASITIRLYADGTQVAVKTVTAADGWAWSFTGLPKYADGAAITYTITEDPVRDYTTMVVDYDVINTHTAEKTSVSGMKFWFDEDDAYGVRPASITIHLLANGRRVASKVVTENDFWEWEFTDLPMNENGSPIDYTIEEDPVPIYESVVVGYNVFNTYDRTTFSVMKRWEGEHGGEISLTLYADGVRLNPQPEVTRYGEMYVWEDLPLFNDDGEEIVYSATERYMDGYMTIYENVGEHTGETDHVYAGGTIVNRGVTNLFVQKVWQLGKDEVPPPINLVVYRNGVATDIPMPAPDAHGWYKYYNLPTMVNGELVRYTIRETSMEGFMAVYTDADGNEIGEGVNGGVITNVMIPATGDPAALLLWAVMALAAGAGLLALRRRRV